MLMGDKKMTRLHHVAISTKNYDADKELFEKLGMTLRNTTGEKPNRQLWFNEGIQLKEVAEYTVGNSIDHVALGTPDAAQTRKIALENGCGESEKGDTWFVLPGGVMIELIQE